MYGFPLSGKFLAVAAGFWHSLAIRSERVAQSDFDLDGDVDNVDFASVAECMTGPN